MNITIRDLQETLFRKFKAKAAEENIKLGVALTQAIGVWLKEQKEAKEAPKGKLSNIKITHWGKGTERSSEEIDTILYGGELP